MKDAQAKSSDTQVVSIVIRVSFCFIEISLNDLDACSFSGYDLTTRASFISFELTFSPALPALSALIAKRTLLSCRKKPMTPPFLANPSDSPTVSTCQSLTALKILPVRPSSEDDTSQYVAWLQVSHRSEALDLYPAAVNGLARYGLIQGVAERIITEDADDECAPGIRHNTFRPFHIVGEVV